MELDRWLSGHHGGGTEDWRVEAEGGLRRGLQPQTDREADWMPRRVPAWTCAVGRAARLRGQFGDRQRSPGMALLTTVLAEWQAGDRWEAILKHLLSIKCVDLEGNVSIRPEGL